MDEKSAQVFLPSRERCFERLRLARFGETVTCVHCGSDEVVKRGTTGKDAQQYWCKACETYFNDLTKTIFGHHRFELEEMFDTVKEMRSENQVTKHSNMLSTPPSENQQRASQERWTLPSQK